MGPVDRGSFVLGHAFSDQRSELNGRRGKDSAAVADVDLTVFDLLGRSVGALVNERKAPGSYEVRFEGAGLASGSYMCRLTAGGSVETRKMILIR